MGNFHRWFVVICCAFAVTSAAQRRKSIKGRFADYQPYQGVWNDDFDWSMLQEVLLKAPGNAVLSPLSVKVLLALLYEGSVSETQRELSKALSGSFMPGNAIDKLSDDVLRYKQQQGRDLLIADHVFYDQSVMIVQKFHSIITSKYNASTEAVDFQNSVAAAAQINRWITENSRDAIKDVVKPDALQDTILMLINTIYFKGSWDVPFPTNATTEKPFYLSPADSRSAGFRSKNAIYMKQREHVFYYRHSDELGAAFLRLPYQDNQLSMMLILPDEQQSLDQLLPRLTPQVVHQVLDEMEEEEVEIELPKFGFTYASSMRDCLQKLGLTRVFSDDAELPLISRGRSTPLKVSTILQKSCIVVDEQGTEAAAATEGTLVFTILNQPVQFIANRPFLFLIYDEGKGNWLFAGKVLDPTL